MQIVIDIPDSFRNSLLEGSLTNDQILDVYRSARNGVILPKGHGKIIDEYKITKCEQVGLIIEDGNITRCLVTDAPTIIEADKGSEGEDK